MLQGVRKQEPPFPNTLHYRKPSKAGADPGPGDVLLYEGFREWPESGILVAFGNGKVVRITSQKAFREICPTKDTASRPATAPARPPPSPASQ